MKPEMINDRHKSVMIEKETVAEAFFYSTGCADTSRAIGKWEIMDGGIHLTLCIRYSASGKMGAELDVLQLKILDGLEDSLQFFFKADVISDMLCIRIGFTGHRITDDDMVCFVQRLTAIGDALVAPLAESAFSGFFFPL